MRNWYALQGWAYQWTEPCWMSPVADHHPWWNGACDWAPLQLYAAQGEGCVSSQSEKLVGYLFHVDTNSDEYDFHTKDHFWAIRYSLQFSARTLCRFIERLFKRSTLISCILRRLITQTSTGGQIIELSNKWCWWDWTYKFLGPQVKCEHTSWLLLTDDEVVLNGSSL